jgi:hypothetical protein
METLTAPLFTPIVFDKFETVEPKDLTSFTQEYLDHTVELQKYLRSSLDSGPDSGPIKLLLKRIESGSFIKKIVTGTVKKINGDQFDFLTKEDLNGHYEHATKIVIRMDSVFGVIPLLPSADHINIATIPPGFKDYLRFLSQVREKLILCEGTDMIIRIDYRFDKEEKNRIKRDGKYYVLCKIKKVNKSNVEYLQLKASAYIDSDQKILDLGACNKIARFISPDCYVSSIRVFSEENVEFSFHDDGD